jgi:hypothetical protein
MPNAQCPILNARCGTGQGYDHVKLYDGASSWSGSAYDWEDFGKDPASVAAMPRLLAESGRMGDGKRALPSVVSEAGSALLVFHSDGGAERPGGFLLRWTLQQLQPPERPAAPKCPAEFVTMSSVLVRWLAPASTLPLLGFLLEYFAVNVRGSTAPNPTPKP